METHSPLLGLESGGGVARDEEERPHRMHVTQRWGKESRGQVPRCG